MLRQIAQILAVVLEQVVGEQHHRRAREYLARTSSLRPIRVCSAAKGATRPSFITTISPSITVPSGRAAPAAASSGKRSVTSSSPRDPDARGPAAADELRADAVPLPLDEPLACGHRATRPVCVKRMRKKERIRMRAGGRAGVLGRDQRTERDGIGPPADAACSRSAVARRSSRRRRNAAASARVTSSRDTPTRKLPPSSFSNRKRPEASSSSK